MEVLHKKVSYYRRMVLSVLQTRPTVTKLEYCQMENVFGFRSQNRCEMCPPLVSSVSTFDLETNVYGTHQTEPVLAAGGFLWLFSMRLTSFILWFLPCSAPWMSQVERNSSQSRKNALPSPAANAKLDRCHNDVVTRPSFVYSLIADRK